MALVIPYGTVSAVELDLVDVMDKIVVDDWGQAGIGPLGALRAHVDSGGCRRPTCMRNSVRSWPATVPGASATRETILFWHRGLSITDIALGEALLAKARARGLGTQLAYR